MTPQSSTASVAVVARRPRPLAALLLAAAMLLVASPADAERRRKRGKKPKPAAAATSPAAPAPTSGPGVADPTGGAAPAGGASTPSKGKGGKEQSFDFTGLSLAGSMRMPQLLYFLDRAEEELERASLERRSFVPEMVRSIDEEAL